jgi:hypothetical protein
VQDREAVTLICLPWPVNWFFELACSFSFRPNPENPDAGTAANYPINLALSMEKVTFVYFFSFDGYPPNFHIKKFAFTM